MTLMSNIAMNIYSILLLAVICFQAQKNTPKSFMQHRLYIWTVQVTILSLVLDTFSRFDGNPESVYTLINFLGNFFVYLTNLVLPSIWLLYTHFQVFYDEKKTMELVYPLVIFNMINGVLVVISQYSKWFYYIDANNIYHRGEYFWVSNVICFLPLFVAFILTVSNRKLVEKRHYFALVFFPIPPVLFVLAQITIYGSSLILNGVTLSLLIVFLNIQNHSMNTDYLTGVYNRKRLESYMKDMINSCSSNKTFSAILIDVDRFKVINDTFGHCMGDDALEATVMILRSCLRATDFIARYGGDEFYIILETCNAVELEEVVQRIDDRIERHNEQGNKPYELSLSMGYAVYDFQSHMDVKAFQEVVDSLMYNNKRLEKR